MSAIQLQIQWGSKVLELNGIVLQEEAVVSGHLFFRIGFAVAEPGVFGVIWMAFGDELEKGLPAPGMRVRVRVEAIEDEEPLDLEIVCKD